MDHTLDGLAWEPSGDGGFDDAGIPRATHTAVLDIMGHKLRCYTLADGRRIINADDVSAFLGAAALAQQE
jgi:hypothetical protein